MKTINIVRLMLIIVGLPLAYVIYTGVMPLSVASPLALILAGFLGLVIAIFSNPKPKEEKDKELFIRGCLPLSVQEAREKADELSKEGGETLFWGGLALPSRIASTHFLVCGATGSGKTITLRLLMQSVLPRIKNGSDGRALIYDAKKDMLSILDGLGLNVPVITLNPFDVRAAAWDMAADISSPASALQLAHILIPADPRESHRYFSDAARHILKEVVMSLIRRCGRNWTFRDITIALKSTKTLKLLLSDTPENESALRHFDNALTAQNVQGTIVSYLHKYEIIAALWDKAERKVSLEEWVKGEFVLVLGNDERLRETIDLLNRAIFKRASELLLSQSESESRRSWIFLDEAQSSCRFLGLDGLLTRGRSKGVCVVLGIQDIEGFRCTYGRERANELLGLCSNRAFLRTSNAETAEWASRLVGDKEVLETKSSESSSRSHSGLFQGWRSSKGSSQGVSKQIVGRRAVLASEFMTIPVSDPENGLTGYYTIPVVGTYRATIPGDWIKEVLKDKSKSEADFLPHYDSAQYLTPWSDSDRERLKIDVVAKNSKDGESLKAVSKDYQQHIVEPVEQPMFELEGVKLEVKEEQLP